MPSPMPDTTITSRPRNSSAAAFFPIFITVFLLVMIISAAITFILPESYASTARIKVEPNAPTVSPTNGLVAKPVFPPDGA